MNTHDMLCTCAECIKNKGGVNEVFLGQAQTPHDGHNLPTEGSQNANKEHRMTQPNPKADSQSPAEALRQQIEEIIGVTDFDLSEPYDKALDNIMKLVTAYAATVERKCEVCGLPATRHGVETRGDIKLTFGYFCDTCVAYPCSAATKPDNFELVRLAALQGPQNQTDDGIDYGGGSRG